MRLMIAFVAFTFAAFGQTTPPLKFEVASVKSAAPCCEPGQWPANRPGVDRINFRNVSLWWCITYAYGIRSYQLSGPDWLKTARYDIVAKGGDGTTRQQLPEMMQALLAERLKLTVHRETKEISGIALVVGKDGPKLTEAAAGSGDGHGGANIGMSMSADGIQRMDVKNGGMATLATTLTSLIGRPVVDKTGLTGRYDFVLEFSRGDSGDIRATGGYNEPPSMPGPPPGSQPGLSIFSSVRQLGLRLDAEKMPASIVVVDTAEKSPIEN